MSIADGIKPSDKYYNMQPIRKIHKDHSQNVECAHFMHLNFFSSKKNHIYSEIRQKEGKHEKKMWQKMQILH